MSFDADTFGSFTLALLEGINDDYAKKGIISAPYLAAGSFTADVSEVRRPSNLPL